MTAEGKKLVAMCIKDILKPQQRTITTYEKKLERAQQSKNTKIYLATSAINCWIHIMFYAIMFKCSLIANKERIEKVTNPGMIEKIKKTILYAKKEIAAVIKEIPQQYKKFLSMSVQELDKTEAKLLKQRNATRKKFVEWLQKQNKK